MGTDLLRTFVSHHVQPLRQQEMTMRGIRGHVVLIIPSPQSWTIQRSTLGWGGGPCSWCNQNFGSGPIPLRDGVDNPWVSLLELTSISLCQFLLINTYIFLSRIFRTRAASQGGVILPEDVVRPEAIRINNELLCEWRQMSVGAHKIPISCANMSSKCIK
jgi:hypothetical protein